MAGRKSSKAKTTPAAGTKRKASQMTDDAAGPAAPLPLFASGPSAEAPSASPRTPWDGLPKPKGKPQRQHYHSELAQELTSQECRAVRGIFGGK
ncbi:hypothetical protein FDENT_2613 [Fusarium denticulatum]|uniref:Uncharacterized protein n=1 Tax=Fusarium denticulatum TaxID=48507 RepID=A0A8H5XFG4_9HYPO|nr:hypothetical protein FDENT_2613 [Fusarium denticulatum]